MVIVMILTGDAKIAGTFKCNLCNNACLGTLKSKTHIIMICCNLKCAFWRFRASVICPSEIKFCMVRKCLKTLQLAMHCIFSGKISLETDGCASASKLKL